MANTPLRNRRADSSHTAARLPHHPGPRPSIARAPRRRRAVSPKSSTAISAATLASEILAGVQDRAASSFADARHLALRLHDAEQRGDARLALSLALSFNDIAHDAHHAAEIAAEIAAGLAAQEGEASLW